MFYRIANESGVIVDIELLHQANFVRTNGFRAQIQALGNEAEGMPGGNQDEHLKFAFA